MKQTGQMNRTGATRAVRPPLSSPANREGKGGGAVSGWMRLSALRLPPLRRGSCNSLTSGATRPEKKKCCHEQKAKRTCRRQYGRRGMMPSESIATCSSSGACADISRAAAPGDAAGIKAFVWRAAATAFRTKPALLRKLAWQPKRRRTPTASPGPQLFALFALPP